MRVRLERRPGAGGFPDPHHRRRGLRRHLRGRLPGVGRPASRRRVQAGRGRRGVRGAPAGPAADRPRRVAFVDGTLRTEARLTRTDADVGMGVGVGGGPWGGHHPPRDAVRHRPRRCGRGGGGAGWLPGFASALHRDARAPGEPDAPAGQPWSPPPGRAVGCLTIPAARGWRLLPPLESLGRTRPAASRRPCRSRARVSIREVWLQQASRDVRIDERRDPGHASQPPHRTMPTTPPDPSLVADTPSTPVTSRPSCGHRPEPLDSAPTDDHGQHLPRRVNCGCR